MSTYIITYYTGIDECIVLKFSLNVIAYFSFFATHLLKRAMFTSSLYVIRNNAIMKKSICVFYKRHSSDPCSQNVMVKTMVMQHSAIVVPL